MMPASYQRRIGVALKKRMRENRVSDTLVARHLGIGVDCFRKHLNAKTQGGFSTAQLFAIARYFASGEGFRPNTDGRQLGEWFCNYLGV